MNKELDAAIILHNKAIDREMEAREDRLRLERIIRDLLAKEREDIVRDSGMESGNGVCSNE